MSQQRKKQREDGHTKQRRRSSSTQQNEKIGKQKGGKWKSTKPEIESGYTSKQQ